MTSTLAHKEACKKWEITHREVRKGYAQKFNITHPHYQRDVCRKFRKNVIDHYGGKCVCCGESHYEFLEIDHINGGGKNHRKQMLEKGEGHQIERWLVANNYPEGFQLLCGNCHNAKSFYGQCPHEEDRR